MSILRQIKKNLTRANICSSFHQRGMLMLSCVHIVHLYLSKEACVCCWKCCSLARVTDQSRYRLTAPEVFGPVPLLWCVIVTGWTWWALSSSTSFQTALLDRKSPCREWMEEGGNDKAIAAKTRVLKEEPVVILFFFRMHNQFSDLRLLTTLSLM